MSDFPRWVESFDGLIVVPVLALGFFAMIDALGGLIVFLNWLWGFAP